MKKHTKKTQEIKSTGRDIKILIFQPTEARKESSQTPGILWIHGGGYAIGMAETAYISRPLALVEKYGAVVVCVNYRLSPKHPYPAALEDCYSALCWLKDNAEMLGVNDSKIMVGGESAGGGLTAALCMYARDKGTVKIAYQMPLYPMLDDRNVDPSKDIRDPIWNARRNRMAWNLYLKDVKDITPYASPARQTDYTGLPPAYTFVGEKELFYCETVTYIENLKAAGIEASVDVYQDWFHAYDIFFPFKEKAKIAIERFEEQYCYAAEHYISAQGEKLC